MERIFKSAKQGALWGGGRGGGGGSGLNKNQIKGMKNMNEDYITTTTLGLFHPYIYRVITPLDLYNPLANPQKNPFSLSKARFN